VRGLGALAALEGRQDEIEEEVWDVMDLAVSEMIIDSVAGLMKAELQSKTAEEAFMLLKERHSRTGVSSYYSVGMRLCALRQLP
jgi:MoxR-like ATPase